MADLCDGGPLLWRPFAMADRNHSQQCYLQISPYLPLPRKHSPDGASPDWGCGHLIAAYYSFIYPERMKGWVGLGGWLHNETVYLPELPRRQSPIPVLTGLDVDALIETNTLLLHQTANNPGAHTGLKEYWNSSIISWSHLFRATHSEKNNVPICVVNVFPGSVASSGWAA